MPRKRPSPVIQARVIPFRGISWAFCLETFLQKAKLLRTRVCIFPLDTARAVLDEFLDTPGLMHSFAGRVNHALIPLLTDKTGENVPLSRRQFRQLYGISMAAGERTASPSGPEPWSVHVFPGRTDLVAEDGTAAVKQLFRAAVWRRTAPELSSLMWTELPMSATEQILHFFTSLLHILTSAMYQPAPGERATAHTRMDYEMDSGTANTVIILNDFRVSEVPALAGGGDVYGDFTLLKKKLVALIAQASFSPPPVDFRLDLSFLGQAACKVTPRETNPADVLRTIPRLLRHDGATYEHATPPFATFSPGAAVFANEGGPLVSEITHLFSMSDAELELHPLDFQIACLEIQAACVFFANIAAHIAKGALPWLGPLVALNPSFFQAAFAADGLWGGTTFNRFNAAIYHTWLNATAPTVWELCRDTPATPDPSGDMTHYQRLVGEFLYRYFSMRHCVSELCRLTWFRSGTHTWAIEAKTHLPVAGRSGPLSAGFHGRSDPFTLVKRMARLYNKAGFVRTAPPELPVQALPVAKQRPAEDPVPAAPIDMGADGAPTKRSFMADTPPSSAPLLMRPRMSFLLPQKKSL